MELTAGRVFALWAIGMLILSTLSLASSAVHAQAIQGLGIALGDAQLLLDRPGQVKEAPDGRFEIRDRQYEAEFAAIPVVVNGVQYTASEVKVISSLKSKAGAAEHQGTIDIDMDAPLGSALPSGHITLEYKGLAVVSGSLISSGGVFKPSKATGVFSGIVSEGAYSMAIMETGSAFGSPATVSITTAGSVQGNPA